MVTDELTQAIAPGPFALSSSKGCLETAVTTAISSDPSQALFFVLGLAKDLFSVSFPLGTNQ
jgi:hypothetical protein